MVKKSKTINTSGKRKHAVARVAVKPGTGIITINRVPLASWGTPLLQMRIKEPLILCEKHAGTIDISVNVFGGGSTGQADAVRLAIGRALVEIDKSVRQTLLDYDRTLVVADVRRKESRKPNSHGKARAKRQKSYR